MREILDSVGFPFLELHAQKSATKKSFETVNESILKSIFGTHRYVVIHEAQYIEKLQEIIEEILSGEWNVTLILTCSYEPMID